MKKDKFWYFLNDTVISKNYIVYFLFSIIVQFLNAQLPDNIPTNGLVAYYPFNGNANDESGNGYNGIFNSGTNGSIAYTFDRLGNANAAILFESNPIWNSLGPYIELENSQNLLVDTDFTINYFVNISSINLTGEIINKGPDNIQGNFISVALNDGILQNGVSQNGVINIASFPDDIWKMVTVINNEGFWEIYIDANLTASSQIGNITNNSNVYNLGAMPSGGSNGSFWPFQGMLDDIGFWNRALTPQEIIQIYNDDPECSIPDAPIGNAQQFFCDAPMVANLSATGENIQWYDAATEGNLLDSTTLLIDGQLIYGSQTIDGCESTDRLEVTVFLQSVQIIASSTEVCGEEITLSLDYMPPTICDMDITLTNIPLGDNIPGFTYGGFYNNHHYYVYNSPTSWTEGEEICRQNGGYLVCINSEEENTFVSNLTDNNIWIGLFRDPDTCEFRWLDCIDITYTNWRPGEPNSGPCGEPYAQIIRGCSFGYNTWNNLGNDSSNGPCYSNMVPIMEIDPSIYESNFDSNASFLWSSGDTTTTISVTPTETTEYWVDVTTNGVTCREYITIDVSGPAAPTGDAQQTFCAGSTVADLTAIGENIQWYDAALEGNLLDPTTTLTDGQLIHASQTINSCESNERLAVSVLLNNPQITANTTSVCVGSTVTLTANMPSTSSADNCSLPLNLQDGLSGYWPFCGNANDESGNGNNGIVTGATLTEDRFGNPNNAYSFDGVNDYIETTRNHLNHFTASVWLNLNSSNCFSAILDAYPSSWEFLSDCFSGTNLSAAIWNNLTTYQIYQSNYIIPQNNWINVVMSYGNNNLKIYSDGNLVYEGVTNAPPSVNGLFYFGRSRSGTDSFFNGILDDIAIWDRILTPEEILQLYTPAPTYLWSNGETTENITINPAETTTYWVDVTVNGVTCRKEITINVNPNLSPEFAQVASICEGDTLNALPTTSNNGITGTWSPELNNTATTNYTFIPDTNQCATTANMTIIVNPNIEPEFTQVASICEGDTLNALPTTSNNGITGTWSPALNNTATTNYTFTPDIGQCAATTNMTIIVNLNVTPEFAQVASICEGDTLNTLPTTSNNGITGTWSPALNNTATTNYTFTPDDGQCATIASMIIEVNFNIDQIISDIVTNGFNIEIITAESGDFSYSIDNGVTFQYGNIFYDLPGGIYNITVRDNFGCGLETITFLHLVIPKYFTPNNDGFNDFFEIRDIETLGNTQAYIFDRYGKLLKSFKNSRVVWDGTYLGNLMPTNDYWYKIIINGEVFTGHFTLKR